MSTVLHLMTHASNVLADGTIDNPAPQNPLSSSTGGDLITGYVKYAALFVCGIIAVASGGWAAFGGLTDRPNHKTKGLIGVICAIAGAVVVAVGIPLINGAYNAVA